MEHPTPPATMRRLRNHLIDLQLADDPNANLIAEVYARLVELERFAYSRLVHPSSVGADNGNG